MLMLIIASIASIFVFFSFFMKTMIPLRIIAIISNIIFISYALVGIKYGIFEKVLPILILHLLLLPLNIVRLYQMIMLIKRVKAASNSDSIEYLIPYMRETRYSKDDVLFQKGDKADCLLFLQKGCVLLPEIGKQIEEGSVFGEVGLFAHDNARAVKAVCATECTIFKISIEKVHELYYQNPQFGFFLMRLVAKIVKDNREVAA